MSAEATEVLRIAISVYENRTTHLLMAFSEDLPGLTIAARSHEQIFREAPEAIRELLEAQGRIVLSVETEDGRSSPAFISNLVRARAVVAAANERGRV